MTTLYKFMLDLITIYFIFLKEGDINIGYMVLQKGPKGYKFSDFMDNFFTKNQELISFDFGFFNS